MIEHKEHFHGSDLEKIEKIYGISKENIINFAANVNPLGESAKLKDALYKRIDAITQYPDREYTSLRKAIAKYCQCDYNDLVVGNGCTELISLFIQVTSPKQTLIIEPTYSEYERDLKLNGSKVCYFDLEENNDFRINTDDLLKNITPETDLIIICNPNNPTAGIIFPDELRTILAHCKNTNTYVMIDETYIEFSTNVNEISAISLCHEFDNLIVLRGTSKFFATLFFVLIEVMANSSFPPRPRPPAFLAFVTTPSTSVPAGMTMTLLMTRFSSSFKGTGSPTCAFFELNSSRSETSSFVPFGIYASPFGIVETTSSSCALSSENVTGCHSPGFELSCSASSDAASENAGAVKLTV